MKTRMTIIVTGLVALGVFGCGGPTLGDGPSKCVAPVVERIAEFHQSETAKASCDTNATEGYYCNQQAKTSGCEVSATSPAPFNAYPIGTDVSSCSGRQGVYPCCSLVLDPDNGAFDCLCAWCL